MGNGYPLVTVVIPSYNHANFIQRTIDSVLEQTYRPIEIVVIDGGSKDGTVELLKGYGKRIQWVSEKDRGQAHAINKGLALAKGEFVTWLCSDDFYVATAIEEMIKPFLESDDVGLVYANSYYIADEDAETILGIKAPGDLTLEKLLVYGQSLAQPSSLIRKKILDGVGFLDESLRYAMDYDLWIRLVKVTQSKYIPKVLSYYRLHSFSKTVEGTADSSREVITVARKYGANVWRRHFILRRISILKSYVKKFLGMRTKPVKEWAMWKYEKKRLS